MELTVWTFLFEMKGNEYKVTHWTLLPISLFTRVVELITGGLATKASTTKGIKFFLKTTIVGLGRDGHLVFFSWFNLNLTKNDHLRPRGSNFR
jgi:hypothetical protein